MPVATYAADTSKSRKAENTFLEKGIIYNFV